MQGNSRTINTLSSDQYFKQSSVSNGNLTIFNKLSSTLLGVQCSISMTYSSQQNIPFRHFIVVTPNVQCHMAEEQVN